MKHTLISSRLMLHTCISYGSLICILCATCIAQNAFNKKSTAPPLTAVSTSLPDAPSPAKEVSWNTGSSGDVASFQTNPQLSPIRVAPTFASTIEPGYSSVPLPIGKSFLYAGHEVIYYQFPFRVMIAAGLSQWRKSDPKYGDDGEAFEKRVGASAERQASQAIFSDALLAPALRQDPRYYVLGDQHSFVHRSLYAASRVFITRNDSGSDTLNTSTFLGYGGSAAMAQFYYPAGHRDIYAMSRTYGFSFVGLAAQHEAQEFLRFLVRGQPKP